MQAGSATSLWVLVIKMFTLFSCPKPFTDPHTTTIQRNAITSWTLLDPKPEIILFGDETGMPEICQELKLCCVPQVARNEWGTPLVNVIFEKAVQVASHDFLCYVNADIILMEDFLHAFERVRSYGDEWLMVGSRVDIDITNPLNFNDKEWQKKLRLLVKEKGTPMEWSSDYFVFRKGFFDTSVMPPFALGRLAYDNWFFWYARHKRASIIDASKVVLATHQNHRFSQSWQEVQRSSEKNRNCNLAGIWACSFILSDATHELSVQGIKGRIFRSFFNRFNVCMGIMNNFLRTLYRK